MGKANRIGKLTLSYEELHDLLGMKDAAVIVGVDTTYDRVNILVDDPMAPPSSSYIPRSVGRWKGLFKGKPLAPIVPDQADMRRALRMALCEHGESLLHEGMESFIDKFGMVLQTMFPFADTEEEEDDEDDDTD